MVGSKALGSLVFSCLLSAACRGPNWQAGPALLASPRQVAEALGDLPASNAGDGFDAAALPRPEPISRVRPCCAFGMDLKVKVGAAPVPGYENQNLISVLDLGRHEYNNGAVTVQERGVVIEHNGLIYTCRGGFIDIAHVRDNADLTLYLTLELLRQIPGEARVVFSGDGGERRVRVAALPARAIERFGRWRVAAEIAGWLAYQISIWHEIVTFYGYESVKGFSEKVSSFSPEDLYSNLLGVRLAQGIVQARRIMTRDSYDRTLDAWMQESLRLLQAVPESEGRGAMARVDGRWWDSRKALPDWTLVLRRNLDIQPPQSPWLVSRVKACTGGPRPLELDLEERLGPVRIPAVAHIEFTFTDWVPERFPWPEGRRTVVPADFPGIMAALRKEASQALGPGFDRPE